MKQIIPLLILLTLTLSGCTLDLEADTGSSPNSAPITAASIPSSAATVPGRTAASVPAQTPGSVPGADPAKTYPTRGILSDGQEYTAGNPKTHSAEPVARNLAELTDKTRKENEKFREIFQQHLKENYPEYDFRIVDIMEYQKDGKTFRQARAYAQQSLDIVVFLYYDGRQVFDSFSRDVIQRHNSMNRWRVDFRQHLDPLSQAIVPLTEANLDVSYDYYAENIPKIRLDQLLEPESRGHRRALELYYERPSSDPSTLSETIEKLFQAVQGAGYGFDEYYVHIRESSGTYRSYLIPPGLIGNPQLPLELQQALGSTSSSQQIQQVDKPSFDPSN